MRVPARVEYACLAMMDLALLHSNSKPVRLSDVANNHGIPQRFLVQIMLQMKAAGLVATTRGAAGGYRLARSPDKITLADIIRVLDHHEEPEDRSGSPSAMTAKLQQVWKELAEYRITFLEKISLSDLLAEDRVIEYTI